MRTATSESPGGGHGQSLVTQEEDADSHQSSQEVRVAGALSSGLPTVKSPWTSCPRPTLHRDPKSGRTGPTGSLHIRCEA